MRINKELCHHKINKNEKKLGSTNRPQYESSLYLSVISLDNQTTFFLHSILRNCTTGMAVIQDAFTSVMKMSTLTYQVRMTFVIQPVVLNLITIKSHSSMFSIEFVMLGPCATILGGSSNCLHCFEFSQHYQVCCKYPCMLATSVFVCYHNLNSWIVKFLQEQNTQGINNLKSKVSNKPEA